MAYLQVLPSGDAPSNAQIGDVIHTAGGDFSVVAPHTVGASYNPSSGLWSVKADSVQPSPLPSGRGNADFTNFSDALGFGDVINSRLNQLMQQNAELANAISAFSSAKQYQYNQEEAQKTRDWQEAMSSTAHQREVRDLLAAGLNPVLSSQLGGSSTPAGATATGGSYQGQKSDVDTSLLPYMSSMIGAMLGYNSQMNVAQIQKETALETAKINSATTMYAADKSSQAAMAAALEAAAASRYGSDKAFESGNWMNILVNDIIGSFKDGTSDTSAKGHYYSPMELFKFLKYKYDNPNSKDSFKEWYDSK